MAGEALGVSPKLEALPSPDCAAPDRVQIGDMVAVVRSEAMRKLLSMVERVARNNAAVLVIGETGAGKEMIARAIHQYSLRCSRPFIDVNCAALPDNLAESELFGHEKGAFSGADSLKSGLFEMANHGTLFLDEIGELPLAIQAKLLRVLEERRFERVGGTQSIDVDVRIVVATNRNLQQAVADKSFREDLYFRISAVPLTIPPLRERGKDVLLLAEHFLDKFGREFSKQGVHLSEDATNRILEYRWPGNVRELQNAIERAVILSDSSEITAETLQLQAQRPELQTLPAGMLPPDFSWDGTMEEVVARAVQATERVLLENTMRDCRWNKTRAAEKLGISAKTLAAKLKAAGLES